jgi:hypothetical protein
LALFAEKPSPSNIREAKMKVLTFLFLLLIASASLTFGQTDRSPAADSWTFAVSGDSRNCGDVVMPSIAEKVRQDGAAFYWHLGDYRAIYDFDQDFKALKPNFSILQYERTAWPDFIERQLASFGNLPVYLALGNHETMPPKTRSEALLQFADWYGSSELTKQRLADDPSDHELRAYYHWIRQGVDFITLDNSTEDQFDEAQMDWLAAQLARDAKNDDVRSLVLGMHEALPDGISAGHSMNESAQGTESGRKVYKQLVEFRKQTRKNVYNTACRRETGAEVLSGWIVGTAGAPRPRLPLDVTGSTQHLTDVYGYLLARVSRDGTIQFEFKRINESDVTAKDYTKEFIHDCFAGNSSKYVPAGPVCPLK